MRDGSALPDGIVSCDSNVLCGGGVLHGSVALSSGIVLLSGIVLRSGAVLRAGLVLCRSGNRFMYKGIVHCFTSFFGYTTVKGFANLSNGLYSVYVS